MGMAPWRPSRMQLHKSHTVVYLGSRRTGQDLIGAIAVLHAAVHLDCCRTQPCTSTAAGPALPIPWDNAVPRSTIEMKFVLFIRDSELSHQVFANVRPDAFHVLGHPFGKKLWGEHNLIYKFGDEHKELRRRVAPNFTRRALSTYAALQQRVILAHIRRWLDHHSAGAMSLRVPCRDMNLETSQMVFVGPYLNEKTRQSFGEEYNLFNTGVMAMPVDLPGFAFGRSRLAVERLSHMLAECARESKARMRAGREPECLVDYWMQEIVRDVDEAAATGQPPPDNTDDKDLGNFLFDFLFAAQDAAALLRLTHRRRATRTARRPHAGASSYRLCV
ncbi:hypothetical protein QYE76_051192 [Lolium multiflorum]|uniref:Cytochrome P450 n=1 Tax=Lolium multiflorum TaxID=4521 RepID=A0AAD8ST97_LOLMU|nr:hypothetical protein QYE76_051192 [Lolium multiflorum]